MSFKSKDQSYTKRLKKLVSFNFPTEIKSKIQINMPFYSLLSRDDVSNRVWQWKCIEDGIPIEKSSSHSRSSDDFSDLVNSGFQNELRDQSENELQSSKNIQIPLSRKESDFTKKYYISHLNAIISLFTQIPYNFYISQSDITELKVTKDFILISSDDKSVNLYDFKGVCRKKFKGHRAGVWALSVSEFSENESNKNESDNLNYYKEKNLNEIDKVLIVTGSVDKSVRIFDSLFTDPLQTLSFHKSTVRCILTTNNLILSAGRDSLINIFNKKGLLLKTLRYHKKSVRVIMWKDGWLVSGGYDGLVLLWRVEDRLNDHQKKCKNCESKSSRSISEMNIKNDKFENSTFTSEMNAKNCESVNSTFSSEMSPKNNQFRNSRFTSEINTENCEPKNSRSISEINTKNNKSKNSTFTSQTSSQNNLCSCSKIEKNFTLFRKLKPHMSRVYTVSISSNYMASGGCDGLVNVSDRRGKFLFRIDGHRGVVIGVSVVKGYIHDVIEQNSNIDEQKKNILKEFPVHSSVVKKLKILNKTEYSFDTNLINQKQSYLPKFTDKYLISLSSDGKIQVIDLISRNTSVHIEKEAITCYFLKGNLLFVGTGGNVKVYNIRDIASEEKFDSSNNSTKNNIFDLNCPKFGIDSTLRNNLHDFHSFKNLGNIVGLKKEILGGKILLTGMSTIYKIEGIENKIVIGGKMNGKVIVYVYEMFSK